MHEKRKFCPSQKTNGQFSPFLLLFSSHNSGECCCCSLLGHFLSVKNCSSNPFPSFLPLFHSEAEQISANEGIRGGRGRERGEGALFSFSLLRRRIGLAQKRDRNSLPGKKLLGKRKIFSRRSQDFSVRFLSHARIFKKRPMHHCHCHPQFEEERKRSSLCPLREEGVLSECQEKGLVFHPPMSVSRTVWPAGFEKKKSKKEKSLLRSCIGVCELDDAAEIRVACSQKTPTDDGR